jgi:tRNA-dihydrouridine synthase
LEVGPIRIQNGVFLAPLSRIPDRPFRRRRSGFAVRKISSKQAFYDRERLLPKAHAFE